MVVVATGVWTKSEPGRLTHISFGCVPGELKNSFFCVRRRPGLGALSFLRDFAVEDNPPGAAVEQLGCFGHVVGVRLPVVRCDGQA